MNESAPQQSAQEQAQEKKKAKADELRRILTERRKNPEADMKSGRNFEREDEDTGKVVSREHTEEVGFATQGELRRDVEKAFPGVEGVVEGVKNLSPGEAVEGAKRFLHEGVAKRVETFYNGFLSPSRVSEKVRKNMKVSMMRLSRADKKAVKYSGQVEALGTRLIDVQERLAELATERAETELDIGLDDGVGESYRKERENLETEKRRIKDKLGKAQVTLASYNGTKERMKCKLDNRAFDRITTIEKWRGPLQEKYNALQATEKELKRRLNTRKRAYKRIDEKIKELQEELKGAKSQTKRKTLSIALKARQKRVNGMVKQMRPDQKRLEKIQNNLDWVHKKLGVWETRADKVRNDAQLPETETPVGPRESTDSLDVLDNNDVGPEDGGRDDEIPGGTFDGDDSEVPPTPEGEEDEPTTSPTPEDKPDDGAEDDPDVTPTPEDDFVDAEEAGVEPTPPPGWTGEGVEVVERGTGFDEHKEAMLGVLNEAETGFRIGRGDEYLELTGAYPFAKYDSAGMREALGQAQTPEGKRFYELAAIYKEAEESGNMSDAAYGRFGIEDPEADAKEESWWERAWNAFGGKKIEEAVEAKKPEETEVIKDGAPSGAVGTSDDEGAPKPFAEPPVAVGTEPATEKPKPAADTKPETVKKTKPEGESERNEKRNELERIGGLLNAEMAAMNPDERDEVLACLKKKEGGVTVGATVEDIQGKLDTDAGLSTTQRNYLEFTIQQIELKDSVEKVAREELEKKLEKNHKKIENRSKKEVMTFVDEAGERVRENDPEEYGRLIEDALFGKKGEKRASSEQVKKYLIENEDTISDLGAEFLRVAITFYERDEREMEKKKESLPARVPNPTPAAKPKSTPGPKSTLKPKSAIEAEREKGTDASVEKPPAHTFTIQEGAKITGSDEARIIKNPDGSSFVGNEKTGGVVKGPGGKKLYTGSGPIEIMDSTKEEKSSPKAKAKSKSTPAAKPKSTPEPVPVAAEDGLEGNTEEVEELSYAIVPNELRNIFNDRMEEVFGEGYEVSSVEFRRSILGINKGSEKMPLDEVFKKIGDYLRKHPFPVSEKKNGNDSWRLIKKELKRLKRDIEDGAEESK